jgi:hypothetical protein
MADEAQTSADCDSQRRAQAFHSARQHLYRHDGSEQHSFRNFGAPTTRNALDCVFIWLYNTDFSTISWMFVRVPNRTVHKSFEPIMRPNVERDSVRCQN